MTNLEPWKVDHKIKMLEEEIQSVLPPKVRTQQCDAEISEANKNLEWAKRSDAYDDEQIEWFKANKIKTAKLRDEAAREKGDARIQSEEDPASEAEGNASIKAER